MAASTSRLAIARRRSRIWGRVAIVGFFTMLIAGVTAYYFGTIHEAFLLPSARILDCGTIFAANDLPLAVANCSGVFSDDVVGFILMSLIIAASIAAIVVGTIGERRGSWRR
jgi:ABC-type Na+ efflux pump permease subunit